MGCQLPFFIVVILTVICLQGCISNSKIDSSNIKNLSFSYSVDGKTTKEIVISNYDITRCFAHLKDVENFPVSGMAQLYTGTQSGILTFKDGKKITIYWSRLKTASVELHFVIDSKKYILTEPYSREFINAAANAIKIKR